MNEQIHCRRFKTNIAGQIVSTTAMPLPVGKRHVGNYPEIRKKLIAALGCLALFFQFGFSAPTLNAQSPSGVVQAYRDYPANYNPAGPIQQIQLPARAQYYEYLPRRRGWDDRRESPLDRFLKQSFRQTYGRVEYLNWSYSDPGSGFIGSSGKKLRDGEGFSGPAFIDGARLTDASLTALQLIALKNAADGKVLIQTWEANQRELVDADADGAFYDVIDVINNTTGAAGADGINDDDNDLDIFPRLTNAEKELMLTGQLNNSILFSTGDVLGSATGPSQVAVLAVGQLAPLNAFQLDNNNGFRGVFGIDLTFGAIETDFFVMNKSRSSNQFVPIPSGLLGTPGAGAGGGTDPLVIPVTVNGAIAPDIFDDSGNLVTDSNNYYLIYNESYIVNYETESWGFSQSMFWTLRERPGRFRLSSSLGFRYFDFQEQMLQRGSFSNDPAVADFFYNSELGNDLTSTIDSVTKNHVYGPTAGIRARVGDEKFSFGLDSKVLFGLNTHEARVSVDDLLFVGDDNFTQDKGTEFSPGFEMVADARVKLTDHVTLTAGYNFLWFGDVTRPADNIQYDITAARVPNPPPLGGPDYTINNNVILNKKKTSVSLSGLSVGVLVDW